MARPTILYVEDRPKMRDMYSRVFQEAGARVLAAANVNDAFKVYRRQAFEISALVTDIRLENESEFDVSGIGLATRIAEVDPGLPRIGLTAFDSQVGEGVLDEVLKKTVRHSDDPESIYKHVPRIVEMAQRYDENRFGNVPEDLLALKNKYRISSIDFERLISSWRIADLGRLALLAWHDSQNSVEDDEASPDDSNRAIRFLPVGTPLPSGGSLQSPLAIVTHPAGTGTIAELYGMPLVFTFADDPDEAEQALLEHLFDCYGNIGDPDDFVGPNVIDVIRFRSFLNRLFPSEVDGGHA